MTVTVTREQLLSFITETLVNGSSRSLIIRLTSLILTHPGEVKLVIRVKKITRGSTIRRSTRRVSWRLSFQSFSESSKTIAFVSFGSVLGQTNQWRRWLSDSDLTLRSIAPLASGTSQTRFRIRTATLSAT